MAAATNNPGTSYGMHESTIQGARELIGTTATNIIAYLESTGTGGPVHKYRRPHPTEPVRHDRSLASRSYMRQSGRTVAAVPQLVLDRVLVSTAYTVPKGMVVPQAEAYMNAVKYVVARFAVEGEDESTVLSMGISDHGTVAGPRAGNLDEGHFLDPGALTEFDLAAVRNSFSDGLNLWATMNSLAVAGSIAEAAGVAHDDLRTCFRQIAMLGSRQGAHPSKPAMMWLNGIGPATQTV